MAKRKLDDVKIDSSLLHGGGDADVRTVLCVAQFDDLVEILEIQLLHHSKI
jgi:hypothetical protein